MTIMGTWTSNLPAASSANNKTASVWISRVISVHWHRLFCYKKANHTNSHWKLGRRTHFLFFTPLRAGDGFYILIGLTWGCERNRKSHESRVWLWGISRSALWEGWPILSKVTSKKWSSSPQSTLILLSLWSFSRVSSSKGCLKCSMLTICI